MQLAGSHELGNGEKGAMKSFCEALVDSSPETTVISSDPAIFIYQKGIKFTCAFSLGTG